MVKWFKSIDWSPRATEFESLQPHAGLQTIINIIQYLVCIYINVRKLYHHNNNSAYTRA